VNIHCHGGRFFGKVQGIDWFDCRLQITERLSSIIYISNLYYKKRNISLSIAVSYLTVGLTNSVRYHKL
jgi:hypothetical protein